MKLCDTTHVQHLHLTVTVARLGMIRAYVDLHMAAAVAERSRQEGHHAYFRGLALRVAGTKAYIDAARRYGQAVAAVLKTAA